MDPTITINERVSVVASFKKQADPTQICLPNKMLYQRKLITFTKLGLRHPTTKGKRMLHVFDVSDGSNDYRLEFDAQGLTWTLIAMIEGQNL